MVLSILRPCIRNGIRSRTARNRAEKRKNFRRIRRVKIHKSRSSGRKNIRKLKVFSTNTSELSGEITALNAGLEREPFMKTRSGFPLAISGANTATTGIAMSLGTVIGLFAGYKGGKTDLLVMRLVEIVICFPTFLLLLILMSIMLDYGSRQSILLVILVIGLTGWTGLCRLVRGETLKARKMEYIQSCEAMGTPVWRILLFHLLPNVSAPIFVSFTFFTG